LLSQANPETLITVQISKNVSAVQCIRKLIAPRNPNDLDTFTACLLLAPTSSWAGTTPEYPATLDDFEFGQILELLSCPDLGIRTKVCFHPVIFYILLYSDLQGAEYHLPSKSCPPGCTLLQDFGTMDLASTQSTCPAPPRNLSYQTSTKRKGLCKPCVGLDCGNRQRAVVSRRSRCRFISAQCTYSW